MATPATTTTATSVKPSPGPGELRPLDWWAGMNDILDIGPDQLPAERLKPPVPAFVRLSRLVDPDQIAATRAHAVATDEEAVVPDDRTQLIPVADNGTELTPVADRARPAPGWADSAGRPLFQIGLAAIVAAVTVGAATFGSRPDLSTVEAPPTRAAVEPESVGMPVAGADEEQTRRVLESLVRQAGNDTEADISLVGTASASGDEIRWTATVRNQGPATANGPITVIHTIGSPFELVSVAGTGWDCQHNRSAGTITCELDEDLATGQRRRIGLVTAGLEVSPGASIPSTMSAVAGTMDPNLDNNTINVTAVAGRVPEDPDPQSASAGAAGQSPSGSEDMADTGSAAAESAGNGAAAGGGLDELPRTGSGLALALGSLGAALCLAGRRLTTWSARAQTRSLLVAANIER